MKYQLTFLGTGTSHGVPALGCDCPTCKSADPRDNRLRSSVCIRSANTTLLIDCGPDLRTQLLREDIRKVDALLLTHPHGDHLLGLDDLQMLTQISREELPFYAAAAHIKAIDTNFPYIRELKHDAYSTDINLNGLRWSVPQLDFRPWEKQKTPVKIGDFLVTPIPMMHGRAACTGYRINDLAYLTDCSHLPNEAYQLLKGVDTVVIDGLRWHPHPTHFNFQQACDEIDKINPRIGYLTHLTHDILHERDEKMLPRGIYLPYDGLTITLGK